MSEPLDQDLFADALAVHRSEMNDYVHREDVPPDYLRRLRDVYTDLNRRGYAREAYEVTRLILEGVGYVLNLTDRIELSYRAWRDKALTSSFLGLWSESIDAYEKAISFGEQGAYARIEEMDPGSNAEYEPGNYRELGSMHGRIGAFGAALANFSIAGERLEAVRYRLDHHTYRDELARLYNARALVHMDLGEYEEAAGNALAAARIEEELGEKKPLRFLQAAIDYLTTGRARRELARRDNRSYAPSFSAIGNALRVLKRLPARDRDQEHSDRESEAHLERGRTYILDGDYSAAVADLERAKSLSSGFNLVQHAGEHHLYLGEAHLELGDIELARENTDEAVALANRHGTPETLWQGQYALASVRRAEGYPEEARGELKRCIETIEELRSQYLPESQKISMLGLKDRPYEELVVELCSKSGSNGATLAEAPEITEAFGYVERSKSRVLAERLATKDLAEPADVPAELVDEEKELARSLRALQDPEFRANAATGAYELGEKVEEDEQRLRDVRNRIGACGSRGEEYVAMREASPLDYAAVRTLLAESETGSGVGNASEGTGRVVLVEYFVSEEKVLVFVGRVDFDAPHLFEVGISRDVLQDWAEVFAALKPCNYERLWDLEAWRREMGHLVEPIEECSNEGDIVWIVPHRELHRLPLHALEMGSDYLADRNPVFYTPSASAFRYSRAKDQGRVPETALVLGDSLPEIDPLSCAAEEARAVAALFGTDAYLGNQATKGTLYEEIRRAGGEIDVVHLACHGKFEADAPLESWIGLAATDGDDEQPDLTVEDVLGMELRTILVTLSACESGLSKIHPGEELLGLTRAFLYAGAPALLVSLWSVDDESTGVLMERFYEALRDSLSGNDARTRTSKARALWVAQRNVRSNGQFDHPFHWSSFVLVGNWE